MYGLILDNALYHLERLTSVSQFKEILKSSHLLDDVTKDKEDDQLFKLKVTDIYPEGVIAKVARRSSVVLGISEQEFMEGVGVSFPHYVSQFGYDKLVKLIGRNFRDFLFNLDNVHDYFMDGFPQMRGPSFFIQDENEEGLNLLYRSKRRGFAYYVIGQMKEISKSNYGINSLACKVLEHKPEFDLYHCIIKLTFDNVAYKEFMNYKASLEETSLPVKANVLFDIFPFALVFSEGLIIQIAGNALRKVMPHIPGKKLGECFELIRPMIDLSLEDISTKTNNVFIFKVKNCKDRNNFHIKGIMRIVKEWKKVLFLSSPVLYSLDDVVDNGLFLNDLGLHDMSSDLALTVSQDQIEDKMIKFLADKHEEEYQNIKKRTLELEKRNQIMYKAWIPEPLGIEQPSGFMQIQEATVVVLSISELSRMAAETKNNPRFFINLVDNVASLFDHLSRQHGLFKLETVQDFLAFGKDGTEELSAAERVTMLALDMRFAANDKSTWALRDPTRRRKRVSFSIGINFGTCLGIVQGIILPKFMLVGQTVAKADKLRSLCPPGKILVTKPVKDVLSKSHTIRYGNVPTEITKQINCYQILEKSDHVQPSVASILRAYTKFKGGVVKLHGPSPLNQSENFLIAEQKHSGCAGFKSTVCTIL